MPWAERSFALLGSTMGQYGSRASPEGTVLEEIVSPMHAEVVGVGQLPQGYVHDVPNHR